MLACHKLEFHQKSVIQSKGYDTNNRELNKCFHSRNDSLSIVRKLWRHPTQGFHKVVRLPPCQAHVQNATFFKPYQETFPKGNWSSNHSFSSAMLSWPPKFASLEPASARLRLAILQWRCGLRKPKEPFNQKSRCHAHTKIWKNRCYMNEFAISWFCWCDRSRQLWVFAAPSQKYPPRVPNPGHRRNVFQSPCAVWNDIHFLFWSCLSQNIVRHLPVKICAWPTQKKCSRSSSESLCHLSTMSKMHATSSGSRSQPINMSTPKASLQNIFLRYWNSLRSVPGKRN